MNKKVFISHSSKDKEIADKVCSAIENKGIGCWIAPRDIPYGEQWAGEITRALKEAVVCIFIFSKNSNQSKQVAKEIEIAFDNSVIIIPIRIDNTELNDVLTYYLATVHWLVGYDEKELFDRVEKILLNPSEYSDDFNVDSEIRNRMDATFSDADRENDENDSPVLAKIKSRTCKKYIDRLIANIDDAKNDTTNLSDDASNPTEKRHPNGKHFVYIDSADETTLVFEVVSILDDNNKFTYSYLEELYHDDEPYPDDRTKRVFYNDYSYYYGIPICAHFAFFTFNKKQKYFVLNNAIIMQDKLWLSKKPEVFFWWGRKRSENSPDCNYTTDVSIETFNADAELSSSITIIDLDSLEVVRRQRHSNSKSGKAKASVELKAGKPYFVARVKTEELTINSFTLALGYLHGLWGLPHNLIKAIEMLEEEASPEAYFVLAKVFQNDELLQDNEDYIHYLTLAADLGHIESMLELSNEYINGEFVGQDYQKAIELLERITQKDTEHAISWNNLGWMYLKGNGCKKNLKKACEIFKKAVHLGAVSSFKHLANIALQSKGTILSYEDGLYYLLCYDKLKPDSTEELFEKYQKCMPDYEAMLLQLKQKADIFEFTEYRFDKFVVDSGVNGFDLTGGFPIFQNKDN